MQYVALLRGINVGKNKQVKMELLKKTLESNGYKNVKTLLNSGNVIFETDEKNAEKLTTKLEVFLEKTFGFTIPVLIREMSEIKKLVDSDPFKGIKVTPETRLYVTFLSEKPTSTLKIPYESPEKDFKILQVSNTEVCSVMIVSKERNTTDAMSILEKEFGKKVTTRNWNTVCKLLR